MKKIYRKMMVLMNRKQKLKMVQILFMMVIGAILETASIGLVVPAIQVIMDPACVEGTASWRRFIDGQALKIRIILRRSSLCSSSQALC